MSLQDSHVFPILFRGGISSGEVYFLENLQIKEGEPVTSRNVTGKAYVEAVKLEETAKGARLFCSQEFVDCLSQESKKVLSQIKDNVFEIIWTYFAFECHSYCENDKFHNVREHLPDLLLPAINLTGYPLDYGKTSTIPVNKLIIRGW